MKILLVEDNEQSALFLSKALKKQNYQTEIATDGQTALELVRAFDYDLILLDIMLPGVDGISVCSQLRQEGCQIPIMMVTAKDSTSDRVRGLEAGADEYVVKPCELSELMARIRALLRRGREILPMVLTWENLQLDVNTNEVSYNKKRLHLTPKEYGLLELFLRNPGKTFNRNDLLDRIWSSSESPGEEAVTTQIKGLRQKLKAAGMTADVIETVYGAGYRLREENGVVEEENRKEDSSTLSTISPTFSSADEAEVLAVMTQAWQDFRESFLRERFGLFETALNNLSTGTSDINLLKQAQAEAHRLAGSLGSYGLPLGSKVARETEMLLQTLITWKKSATLLLNRLKTLIAILQKTLQEQPIDEENWTISLAKTFLTTNNSASAKQKELNTFLTEDQILSENNRKTTTNYGLDKLSEIQEEIEENLINKLQLFEQVFKHLSIDILDNELLQQAQFEAHYLAKSFGNYDLPMGSKAAREVEFLLQTLVNWRQHTALLLNRFEKLIMWLKETLQKQPCIPITSVLPQSLSTRLLIVDHDTVLTERIKQEAATQGLQIEVATNLTVAKSMIASYNPNVVLLDIALSSNSECGLDFLARLMEEKLDLPVIVFTKSDRLDYRVEVARFGAYTFLQKSTPVNEVISKIKEAVHPSSVNKAKVLIVDDDPLILSHVKTLLSPWEFQVTTLQFPQQFWDTLEVTNPDLLILDIEMPDFNGIELCQTVRNDSKWHKLPILFLSIHLDAKLVHQIYTVGADDYIKKPIVERELITRIFNRLERTK
jgi:DNA-binding response OmpR family regulator/HPt (histidine-containing phosphotransfer) domain-containing protein